MQITSKTVQQGGPTITIDLDNPKHEEACNRGFGGGTTVARLEVSENGKRAWVGRSVRKSGDARAGSTVGLHVSISTGTIKSNVERTIHVRPGPSHMPV